jgi:hypothetical protein
MSTTKSKKIIETVNLVIGEWNFLEIQDFIKEEESKFFKNSKENSNNNANNIIKELPEEITCSREQIIDWLVHVCNKLLLSDSILFLTVDILDKVLEKYNFCIASNKIHLISIGCLSIACKYYERSIIQLKTLLNHVAHEKYTKKEIISMEITILKKLGFKLPRNNFIDIINIFINMHENINKQVIFEHCKMIYKMTLFNYEFIRQNNLFLTYCSILFLALNKSNKFGGCKIDDYVKIFENILKINSHDNKKAILFCSNLIHQISVNILVNNDDNLNNNINEESCFPFIKAEYKRFTSKLI